MPEYNSSATEWQALADPIRKGYANKAFQDNISDGTHIGPDGKVIPAGQLNEAGYIKQIKDYGLSPDDTQEALKYVGEQKASNASNAFQDYMFSLYGGDSKAASRNGATTGAPQPTLTSEAPPTAVPAPTNQPAPQVDQSSSPVVAASPTTPVAVQQPAPPQPSTMPLTSEAFADYFQSQKAKAAAAKNPQSVIDPDTYANLSVMRNAEANGQVPGDTNGSSASKQQLAQFLGMSNPNPVVAANPPTPVDNSSGATGSSADQTTTDMGDLGSSRLRNTTEGKLPEPDMTPYQSNRAVTTPPDTRSARQISEDSIDPNKSMFTAQGIQAQLGSSNPVSVDANTPAPIKQSIATTLARKQYDNDGSDASINSALHSYMKDKIAAVGPAPMMLPDAKGQIDRDAYNKRLIEWQKNLAGVALDIHNDLGSQYSSQFDQLLAASKNDRENTQMGNDVATQNAKLQGASSLAAGYDKQVTTGDPVLKGKTLNPTSFGSIDELQKFGERASAYAKLGDKMPENPGELLAWAKNFGQAEGLGDTEGTRNLLMMLGAPDVAEKLQIALANGAKLDVPTVVGAGVSKYIGQLKGYDMAGVKSQMKFTKDYLAHSGANGTPTMKTGGSDVQPYQQTPPTAADQLRKGLGMPAGTAQDPITYKSGMKRDPALVYVIPGYGKFYGDGRKAE